MTAHSDRTICILVVDDHQVVCAKEFRGFLNGKPHPEDVGKAPTASRRWTSAHWLPPRAWESA
jgi:hypothetical protein